MENAPCPWVVVLTQGGEILAYPAKSQSDAQESAAKMAQSLERTATVGVYELRGSAVVETSVRFDGMDARAGRPLRARADSRAHDFSAMGKCLRCGEGIDTDYGCVG
jgi:hypothetical protein